MEWHFVDNAPIYSQIVRQMRLNIASGVLAPGERLQSVRDRAVEAGVNPNTMQRALSELERDGLVYSQRTSGRFVTEESSMIDETRRTIAQQYTKDFLEAMERLGYTREDITNIIEGFKKEDSENGDTQVQ